MLDLPDYSSRHSRFQNNLRLENIFPTIIIHFLFTDTIAIILFQKKIAECCMKNFWNDFLEIPYPSQ